MKVIPKEEWVMMVCCICLGFSFMGLMKFYMAVESNFVLSLTRPEWPPKFELVVLPGLVFIVSMIALVSEATLLSILNLVLSLFSLIFKMNIAHTIK